MSQVSEYLSLPVNETRTSPVGNVQELVIRDVAEAEGRRMAGFVGRQVELGFRQSGMLRRPPEVDLGALMDFAS